MGMSRDYILSLVIKRSILGSDDIRDYASNASALVAIGFPACGIMGTKSGRACGFVTCPHCEFARRLTFAVAVGAAVNAHEKAWMEHTRTFAQKLVDFPDALSAADRHRTSRLAGLVGWRRSAGFDVVTKQWTFDHIAVTTEPIPRRNEATTITDLTTYPPSPEPALLDHYGVYSGFVAAVATIGLTPLGVGHADDDVVETREAWRLAGRRLRLIDIVEARGRKNP